MSSTDNNMNFDEYLGKRIRTLYTIGIFGKVLKSEIDLLVFGTLVRQTFQKEEKIVSEDSIINWLNIESKHIRQLSLKLRITESRVSSLLERCALMEQANSLTNQNTISQIKKLTSKVTQETRDIKQGKFRLYIPNKITRAAIEGFLTQNGGIPDTSYNKNILKIRIIDILNCLQEKNIDEKFLIKIAKKANKKQKSKNYQKIIKKADEKTGMEKLQLLSSAILQPFIGKGGEFISEELFRFLENLGEK